MLRLTHEAEVEQTLLQRGAARGVQRARFMADRARRAALGGQEWPIDEALLSVLEAMPPFLGGGEMISSVSYEKSTWAAVPHKFEAGTPPILEGIGLKAAIDYFLAIGTEAISGRCAGQGRAACAIWPARDTS